MNDALPFIKMNGLGNDFVVLDAGRRAIKLKPAAVRAIADRKRGVGCDQVVTLEPSGIADVKMRICNADGSEAETCGNAARCVGQLLMQERGTKRIAIETSAGVIEAEATPERNRIRVDMGKPRFDWRDIPLAKPMPTVPLDYVFASLPRPVAVNVGNPHLVFFVADAEAIPLRDWGPKIENDPLFPERINVNIAQIRASDRIRLRVWERGAGLTLACGSGACATLVAARRLGLSGAKATLVLDGGELFIDWLADDRICMTGPVELSFRGELPAALLAEGEAHA
jgi:diaminopimelate epimerase